MATQKINFSEWLPDQPGVAGALTNAKNVYPKAVGYGPFPEEEAYANPASQELNNIASFKDTSGSTKIVAGGSTLLFLLNSSTLNLDDISASTYTDVSNKWQFARFGNTLIAAGDPNTLQAYDITTIGDFAVLDSGAPNARFVTVVRDFVVTGYQPSYKNRVQWSGINNPNTWASSAVTQSDFQDVPDGGDVRGVTGGEFGLVLLEKAIYRMSYVGAPLVFQFDNISPTLGVYEQNSVVQWQGITYFLSDDGFYACDGQRVIPIGAEKVNRTFFNDVREESLSEMSAAVDPQRNLVVWGAPVLGNIYRLYIYHITTQRWSYADTTISSLASSATPTFSIEDLDVFSNSIDALETPLDSRLWLGGRLLLMGVTGNSISSFTGGNKIGIIETPDITDGNNSMVTLVRPFVDGGSASVAVFSRNALDTQVNFGTQNAANSENRVGVRSLGRYHRFQVSPSGDDWQTAIGIDIEVQPAGMR